MKTYEVGSPFNYDEKIEWTSTPSESEPFERHKYEIVTHNVILKEFYCERNSARIQFVNKHEIVVPATHLYLKD
jgi:hypothetical protein